MPTRTMDGARHAATNIIAGSGAFRTAVCYDPDSPSNRGQSAARQVQVQGINANLPEAYLRYVEDRFDADDAADVPESQRESRFRWGIGV